jgi:hypothetical protein
MLDLFIILFGVMMAWGCSWKAHYHYEAEDNIRATIYVLVTVILLVVVLIEALRVTP